MKLRENALSFPQGLKNTMMYKGRMGAAPLAIFHEILKLKKSKRKDYFLW